MSDASPAAPAPAVTPAAPAAPAPSDAPPIGTVDARPPGATDKPSDAPEKQEPERTFSQKELDEIIEKRLAKERRKRDEIRQERDVLRKLALEPRDKPAEQQPKPAATTGAGNEPKREDFGPYESFIEARADWRADQAVEKRLAKEREAEQARSATEKQTKEREEFQKKIRESAKDIEDFDEVIEGIKAEDPVANVSAVAIEAAEAPGKMLHYLATHPDEAERIASLSVGQQAREVLKLEAKVASKPAPKPSKAPEPIDPVGGRAAVGDEMPDAAKNPEAWIAWRNKQIAAQRGKVRAS